jgi:hypothetical protein
LTIDEENGIILSSMVGAGYKDEENRFYGVLMGDVGVKANDNSIPNSVGLYGFHEGAQSFGFRSDGTAFIGKNGKGRLLFNGSSGVIESSSFSNDAGNCGMRIDLDDGFIELKGTTKETDPDTNNTIYKTDDT